LRSRIIYTIGLAYCGLIVLTNFNWLTVKGCKFAKCQWLLPVILATQEVCSLKPAQANSSQDPASKNPSQKKIGLVEWLKLKALSSSPSTNNNNKNDVNALLSSFPITFPNCF
jgi:hypothetical protein